jgi:hypothetical protein
MILKWDLLQTLAWSLKKCFLWHHNSLTGVRLLRHDSVLVTSQVEVLLFHCKYFRHLYDT